MVKIFDQDLFESAVGMYLMRGCEISSSPNNVTSMRVVYDDFQSWTARKHDIHALAGGTIQRFGSTLRHYESRWGKQLVRGRSGKGKRHVEVYLIPHG
jgi:hypothetical protein